MENAALELFVDRIPSPLGELRLIWDRDGAVRALDYDDYEDRMHDLLFRYYGAPGEAYDLRQDHAPPLIARAMQAYFDGDLTAPDGLAVASSGTAFQRDVWMELRRIPCGTTTTYGALAAAIGRPSASRAVGAANGANPIAIIVPCHRVVGANGTLTGYGGGVARKQWLLTHERADFARSQPILLL